MGKYTDMLGNKPAQGGGKYSRLLAGQPAPTQPETATAVAEPPSPDELIGLSGAPSMQEQIAAEDRGFAALRDLLPSEPPAAPLPPTSQAGTLMESEMGANRPGSAAALKGLATISPAALLPKAPETGKAQTPVTLMEAEMGATTSPQAEQAGQEVFRSVAAMFNPATAASILALGGADKVVQAAARHPRVLAVLGDSAAAKAVLQKLGQLFVPTAVGGTATGSAVRLGQEAMDAYDRGDTEQGSKLFGQAVAAGLVAAGAGAAGVSRMGARPGEVPTPEELIGPSEPTPPRPKLLDEIIRGMEGGKPPAAPKTPKTGQPKVTPQPKAAETAGPRTQSEMAPTKPAEIVRELEPPTERSPLEEIVSATESRGAIPKPPGESRITTGDTTRVSLGPMSEANRAALESRLAGQAEVSKGDDGRTLIDFDASMDHDTAALVVNDALAGERREEPPGPEEVLPSVEKGSDLGRPVVAPADLFGAEQAPAGQPRGQESIGALGEMERDTAPAPSDLLAGLAPATEPEPAALTPDELVRSGEAGPERVADRGRGTSQGDALDILGEPIAETPLPEAVSGELEKPKAKPVNLQVNFPMSKQAEQSLKRASENPIVSEIARNAGIKQVTVDEPYTFDLSTQGTVTRDGTIRLNPNGQDLQGTFLHEVGHVLWARSSPEQQKRLVQAARDSLDLLRKDSPGYARLLEIDNDPEEAIAQMFAMYDRLPPNRQAMLREKPAGKSFAEAFPEEKRLAEVERPVKARVRSWEQIHKDSYGSITEQDDLAEIVKQHGDMPVVIKDVNGGRHRMPASVAARALDDPIISGHTASVFVPSGAKPGDMAVRLDQEILPYLPKLQEAFGKLLEAPAAKPQAKELPEPVSGKRPAGVPDFATPGDQGYRVAIDDITVDPARFQFKEEARRLGGVTGKLKQVEKWDPAAEKTILVWQDPADKKLYVVDGHHRLDLAKRLGVREIQPHFLTPEEAKTAEEARAIGALRNMREGTAAPIDAAKFMRDTGYEANDLSRFGVAANNTTIEKAESLRRLTPPIFGEITLGRIPEDYGVAAGRASEEPAVQKKIIEVITGRENRTGSRVPQSMAESIADRVAHAGTRTTSEQTLFGADEKTESLFEQEAELVDYVRGRLSREKRLFKTVAEGSSQLAEAGNVLVDEKNKAISTGAAQAGELFDRLSKRSGPVNEIIQEAAQRLASGEKAADVKEQTYEQIRTALQEAIPTGRGARDQSAGETRQAEPPEKVTGQQTLYSGTAALPEMLRITANVSTRDAKKLGSFLKENGGIAAGGIGDIGKDFFGVGAKGEWDDLNPVARVIHTPRFIGERWPAFMPLFDRAVESEQERNELAARWGQMLDDYFDLDEKQPKLARKLDNRLISSRYKRTDEVDYGSFDDAAKAAAEPATKAVRDTMHNVFEGFENLAAYKASDGKVTDAAGITTYSKALEAVEQAGLTGKLAEKQAKALWDVLTSLRKMKLQGYVPFTRFGHYVYGIKDLEKPHNDIIESRTNPFSARKRYAKLRKIHKAKLGNKRYKFIDPFKSTKHKAVSGMLENFGGFDMSILLLLAKLDPDFDERTPEDRIAEVARELTESGMKEEDARAFAEKHDKDKQPQDFAKAVEALTTELKRAGFRAHFTPSKEIRGFETNLSRPLADYILGAASHIAKQKFLQDSRKLIRKIPVRQGNLHEYASEYVKYLTSSRVEGAWVRNMMFHAYLGSALGPNIRSPLVNLSQVPMMTYPWLSQYGSDTQVAAELSKAYADVTATIGLTREGGRQVLIAFDKLPEDVRADVKKSVADGTLQSQVMNELAGIARGRATRGGKRLQRAGRAYLRFSGFFFAASEEVNRIVTFVAAHRLYRANVDESKPVVRKQGESQKHGRFLSEFDSPLAFAEDVVEKTQFEYARYNRPQLMRGWTAPLFVFKTFTVNNIEMQQRLWQSWVDANETALTGGTSGGRPPRAPGGPPQPPSGGEPPDGGGPRLPGEPFDPISPSGPKPLKWWRRTAFARSLMMMGLGAGFFGAWYTKEFADAFEATWPKFHHGEVIDLETELRDWMEEYTGRNLANALTYGVTRLSDYLPDLYPSLSMGQIAGIGEALKSGQWEDIFPVLGFPGRIGAPALELLGGGDEDADWVEKAKNAFRQFGGAAAFPSVAKAMEMSERGVRGKPTTEHPHGRRLMLPGGREKLSPLEIAEIAFGFTPTSVREAQRQEYEKTLADISKAGPKAYFLRRLRKSYLAEDEQAFDKIMTDEIPRWNESRALWFGPKRTGTYREISADFRERKDIPEAFRKEVDITWSDIKDVGEKENEPPEVRQLKGVRGSVRRYVAEKQRRYRGEPEVPSPEEVFGVAP